ncbi:histidine utilization repressor [Endozoicomonas sp. OPT23]|uniref:histidine utilization repressor n=1 Tax=Endozoicomonas sp. OPT23 TaxID=2072845 RepID=UPI00129AFE5A|nr:histidine utilization repressor [Endozoicomonas sp. OPT23]MRI34785.1 histidine utilization repressor [Endozoicomonas sp. OPT23]
MTVPVYKRIKQHIFSHIEQGQWPSGSRVPSENKLCEEFSVSRMTARKALEELTREGVLVRSQGLGTFVAEAKPQSSFLEVRNIADEIHERGNQHSARVDILEIRLAGAEQSLALEVTENSELFYSEIIHFENGQPVQREERYVNPRQAPDYLDQNFTQTTPNAYLNRVASLTEATHVVEAVLPDTRIASSLAIATNQPCLKITRRSWCRKGVVSMARLYHPGDRYRLGGHLSF